MENRIIQTLERRTRPDAIGAAYGVAPDDMPPAPPVGQVEHAWFKVINGRNFSMTYGYKATWSSNGNAGCAWYVDEISPYGGPIYPSRTRDAANQWIETSVGIGPCNSGGSACGNGFWPIPYGSRFQAWRGSTGHWTCYLPPVPSVAKVLVVNSSGKPTDAEWYDTGGLHVGAISSVMPTYTNPVPNARAYPYAQVNDVIVLLPICGCGASWIDATPRIMLNGAVRPGEGDDYPLVHTDFTGGSGQVWSRDRDT